MRGYPFLPMYLGSLTNRNEIMTKKPTHFAVEDITFYGMDEDNEIITNDKGEAVVYQLKAGVRFKPLEYLCEDMTEEQLERIEVNL
jgi:hypothetical protein